MDDYEKGIEKAKEIYRLIQPRGCRILSKGKGCTCFLCRCDQEIKHHLTSQYSEWEERDIDLGRPSLMEYYEYPLGRGRRSKELGTISPEEHWWLGRA